MIIWLSKVLSKFLERVWDANLDICCSHYRSGIFNTCLYLTIERFRRDGSRGGVVSFFARGELDKSARVEYTMA